MQKIPVVVVGSHWTGKSTFILRATKQTLPDRTPSIVDSGELSIPEERAEVSFIDTTSDSTYDRLRQLTYEAANAFVAVYSVDNPSTFNDICTKWLPEIKKVAKNIPVLVVGLKLDMRQPRLDRSKSFSKRFSEITTSPTGKMVDKSQVMGVCESQKIRFLGECSAKSGENVKEILLEIVRVAKTPKAKTPHCCLL